LDQRKEGSRAKGGISGKIRATEKKTTGIKSGAGKVVLWGGLRAPYPEAAGQRWGEGLAWAS